MGKKASSCIVGTASVLAFAPGKVATVSAKVYKILKNGKNVRLKNAYRSWTRLGTSNSARFKTVIREVKKFATNVKNTRNVNKSLKAMQKNKAGANTYIFLRYGGGAVADVMGIKGCYDMISQVF